MKEGGELPVAGMSTELPTDEDLQFVESVAL